MPAEIVLEGHLPLEPFLTGMRKTPGVSAPSRFEPVVGRKNGTRASLPRFLKTKSEPD